MKNFKQSVLLLIGLLLLAATSCKKTDVAPASENRLITAEPQTASLSGITVYKANYDIDLRDPKWREYNSCTGEIINITKGIWHIEYTDVFDASTSIETFQFHTNTQDYKLINLNTGIEYTGSYASNSTFTIKWTGQSVEATETLSVLLTTPGGGNNSKLIADVHITILQDGTVTSYFDNLRAGCQ